MAVDAGLEEFAEDFFQELVSRSEFQDQADFKANTFTQMMIEYLTDAGELEEGEVCYYKARGLEVSGYHVCSEEDRLDLFISHLADELPPPTIRKDQAEQQFRRLLGFLEKSMKGLHESLEEASPAFDMAQRIHSLDGKLGQARLFLFTNGQARFTGKKKLNFRGLHVSFHVWDIVRLFRCVSSGRQREPIEIDFVSRFGNAIPCLTMPRQNSDCQVFMTIIPGKVLYELYEEFGPRLLELNVRSFLQARGKVNQGIRRTILEEPGHFLAYNNGISATAEDIKLVELPGGGKGIKWVRNLQIVNGGQTTASIHQAAKKDKADVAGVSVQAKLTVVTSERLTEMVPLISRYANSQNKVNEADFSANDPLHVRIEHLSRTVWAPAPDGTQRQSRWFYERARGQYQDEKNRAGTPAKKKDFLATHPPSQKFTKTDFAKYENTWEQLPHTVSLGAQKNFLEFTLRIAGTGERAEFSVEDYHRLIGKAILFRQAEKLIHALDFGGYRANIVTYSLAFLSHRTGKRIDLDRIWREQAISSCLAEAIEAVAHLVHENITNPPGGRNVTEWCKKEACWERIRDLEYEVSRTMDTELVPVT